MLTPAWRLSALPAWLLPAWLQADPFGVVRTRPASRHLLPAVQRHKPRGTVAARQGEHRGGSLDLLPAASGRVATCAPVAGSPTVSLAGGGNRGVGAAPRLTPRLSTLLPAWLQVDFAEHDVILQLAFVGGAMHLYALAGTMLFFPMLRVRDWAQGGGIANSITRAVSTVVLVSMAAVYTFGPYAIVEQWNATQPTCTVAIAGYTATNMFRLLECIFRVVPDDTVLKEYPMFVHYILPAVPCIIRDGKPVPPKPGPSAPSADSTRPAYPWSSSPSAPMGGGEDSPAGDQCVCAHT